MSEALRFLLLIELIGLAAVPLAGLVLGRLPGAGLAFAKPLGLLAAAYPVWLLASLGVVGYGVPAAVGGVALLVVTGALLWRRTGFERPRGLAGRVLAGGEATFLAAFLGGSLLAAFSPDVRGTEKPMDMAILNAVNASGAFPPHDPWMAGESLNYYYFGHYLLAFVVRLTGVEPSTGYNFSLALVFALSAVAAYALGATLTAAAGGRRPVLIGIVAAFFVCAAGTLDAAQRLVADGGPLREYDWFAAARVIPDAITEFPAFSFLLGDLHAHLLAVPFTLLALGLALQVALAGPRWGELPAVGIVVGSLYAINAWSFPVAAGLVAAAPVLWLRDPALASSLRRAAGWVVGALWLSILAYAPYWLDYDPAAGGVGLVDERRPLALFARDQLLILGVFGWVLAAAFAQRGLVTRKPLRTAAWLAVAALVAGSLLAPSDLAGPLLVAGLVAVALRAALVCRLAAERFAWLLIAGGLACVLAPELVYVRDEFDGSPLFRMNTVFKLGFQAWILLAVIAAWLLPRGAGRLPRRWQRPWGAGCVVLVVLAAVFPLAGTYARKAGFSDGPRLDGLRWLERDAPGDVAAIEWLRRHAAPGAVVLEAVGDDYSEFGHARISTFSGRATVLGWPGHELQWGHDAGSRRSDVAAIYRAPLPAVAGRLLRRYGVDYVVVGPLERTDYGSDGVAKFDRIGARVLDRDGTIVWRVAA